jgi:hypothetical protein
MSSPAEVRVPSRGEWDAYPTILTDLYETQGKTLPEVSSIMENTYGFRATCVIIFRFLLPFTTFAWPFTDPSQTKNVQESFQTLGLAKESYI